MPLIGYSSRLSVRPGDFIDFKVSSEHTSNYTARLFRSVSADPNPEGAGLIEYECDNLFPKQSFTSRVQKFKPGSYGATEEPITIRAKQSISFTLLVYPTFLGRSEQSLIDFGKFNLSLDKKGSAVFKTNQGQAKSVITAVEKFWHRVEATVTCLGHMR